MYTVIGQPATRSFRVLWMLEELGQPYALNPAAPQSEAIRAVNPSGKVPALIEDGVVLTDSVAIMTYLADKHGALSAAPGTLARARQDALTLMILDEVDALLWTAARHTFVLPQDQRCAEVKPSLRWEFGRNIKRLEDVLTQGADHGPYLCGADFTLADILLVHCMNWARVAGFDVPDGPLLNYAKTIKSRPAYQRVAALAR